MAELTGWLLDVYEDPQDGVALWLLGEDGQRYRLHHDLPVTFCAAGNAARLRELWQFLEDQPEAPRLTRSQGRDLFCPQPLDILEAQVEQAAAAPRLFQRTARAFPDLTYYNADLPLALRHAALHGTFPLARCRMKTGAGGYLEELEVLDTPWELDPPPAPLRILSLEPDANPAHATPRALLAGFEGHTCRLPLEPARPLMINLRALLVQHDPDLLLTSWGDTWLLPHLLALSRETGIELPLNRQAGRGVARRPERTYFSYGQIIFRGRQVHLFGRWHIDRCNAMLWDDYELAGALEVARVTSLPAQVAARVSPGSGISSMQMLVALRQGVMIPWHKQQAEHLKSAMDFLRADQGGLVYQPLIGVHQDVGEIDFISMYPSVMVRCNISPETEPVGLSDPLPEHLGLVPQTLEPLLGKRIALKHRLADRPAWDPRRKADRARISAHKWLLVTCFGYLGYKNARFGRIEAHEAVTANGREALLRAKEVSEKQGYTVLHMYVDGLWIKKEKSERIPSRPADFQPLLEDIVESTGLPLGLDGIYRWVAFLPARRNVNIPVPNRYFGVFQDGSMKVRGIEARRRDTPPFVAETQMDILRILAQAPDAAALPDRLPEVLNLLRSRLSDLRSGRVPLEKLLAGLKLSRELDRYRTPSPAARAAAQLQALGRHVRPGQRVRMLFMRGEPGVWAWDLPEHPNPAALDLAYYRKILLRAAGTVLQPFGLDEDTLIGLMQGGVDRPIPGTDKN